MVPQRVIEVRCERCQASFAPETRRCVHCGGRLTPARVLGGAEPAQAVMHPQALPSAGPAPEAAGGVDQEEEAGPPSPAHNLIWVVMAVVAILGSILGRC